MSVPVFSPHACLTNKYRSVQDEHYRVVHRLLHLPVPEVGKRIIYTAIPLIWTLEQHASGSTVCRTAQLDHDALSANSVR